MTASKIFIYLWLSFIGGIFINSFILIYQPLWLAFLILGTVLILLKKKKIIVFGFCFIFLAIGILRHQSVLSLYNRKQTIQYDQNITLKGKIVAEPEIRINKINLTFKSDEIYGKILITTDLYPVYSYGDKLEINGTLKMPAEFEDFDYREYLSRDKIYSVIYRPKIALISRNQGNIIYQFIFNFKNKLRKNIEQTLLSPRSSILKAILLGDKQEISNNLKEKFNLTGTRHIIAISGMHMIIMSEIILFLLLAAGFWRKQAFYFVAILLLIYIIMIGLPSSAVRAGIMAGLLLLAQHIGRLRVASSALIFTAGMMLAANPLLLKIDVGFQLSFAASLSIIYIKPFLDKKLKWLPEWLNLKDILTLTLAAQIGVMPLSIFYFGQLSLISPLANLLVVPLVPILMFGGLLISFTGLFCLPLARILAWPVWLLLSYIIKIVEMLAAVPLASLGFKNMPWVILVGWYTILAALLFVFYKNKA